MKKIIRKIKTKEKIVFLTFDDGPHPEITPKILAFLDHYQAKACFFCVGNNIQKYPETFDALIAKGHQVGNHTFSHKRGWITSVNTYYKDFLQTEAIHQMDSFRPPHGRIRLLQLIRILKSHPIVFWSLLAKDYRQDMSPEQCLERLKKKTRKGSIVVFHDSEKAARLCLVVLPDYLQWLKENGYVMNMPLTF